MNCEILDFHCHPFEVSEQNICSYINERPDSPDAFEVCMDRAGIVRFAGSVVERLENPTFEKIHELNEAALRLRDYYEGRFIPGIHIHPSYVKESCDELEAMSKRGVKLIGELVPYMMGWKYYASEEATEIFGVAGELGMVVSAHSIDMDDMDEIVRKLPNTNFVFAHPGEKATYMRQIERMEKYKNAYLDLSGTGLFRYAMLAHGVNRVGAERFLFGTDFPVCNAAMQVAAVLSEYLTDEDYELIFSGNAKRLLGL